WPRKCRTADDDAAMTLSDAPAVFKAMMSPVESEYCPGCRFTIPTMVSSPIPAFTSFRIISLSSTSWALRVTESNRKMMQAAVYLIGEWRSFVGTYVVTAGGGKQGWVPAWCSWRSENLPRPNGQARTPVLR